MKSGFYTNRKTSTLWCFKNAYVWDKKRQFVCVWAVGDVRVWFEQQKTAAVGLGWQETLVCGDWSCWGKLVHSCSCRRQLVLSVQPQMLLQGTICSAGVQKGCVVALQYTPIRPTLNQYQLRSLVTSRSYQACLAVTGVMDYSLRWKPQEQHDMHVHICNTKQFCCWWVLIEYALRASIEKNKPNAKQVSRISSYQYRPSLFLLQNQPHTVSFSSDQKSVATHNIHILSCLRSTNTHILSCLLSTNTHMPTVS